LCGTGLSLLCLATSSIKSDDPYFFDADDDEVTAFQIKHNGADITNIVDDYVYNSLYELFIQEARGM